MLYIAQDINSGVVGNTFVQSVSVAVLDFFFRELANLILLGHWLRIPPLSCTFLLRSVLPCAGSVLALISDILYTDSIKYNHIPTLVSLAICRLDL